MTMRLFITSLALLALASPVSAANWSWPAGNSLGSELTTMDPLFEPSGAVWSQARNSLIVVGDEGQVAELTESGSVLQEWKLGSQYDLEAVTIANTAPDLIYLGNENTSSALEFNLSTGQLTGRAWSFASKISEVDGASGLEGLTFVPDGSHPFGTTISGGVFYAGWQYDGDIYVFAPDFEVSGAQTFLEEIHMTSGYTDLSALTFNGRTGLTYALYDGLNLIEERNAQGLLVSSYTAPGSNQEGIVVKDNYPEATATIFIAEDSGQIYSYTGFPLTYPTEPPPVEPPAPTDVDGDGTPADADCNDTDPSIAIAQTYYLDNDADGLGAGTGESLCNATAPAGYATNALDTDDTIPNAGVEIYGDSADNDSDGQIDESNTLSENGLHPYFGTLTPTAGSGFGTEILSAANAGSGDILVEYRDHSRYVYDVFSLRASATMRVTSLDSSAYLIVAYGKGTAVVNGYTGEVVATTRGFKHYRVALAWARSVVGW